jgi:phosphate transport system substrate-binding protein
MLVMFISACGSATNGSSSATPTTGTGSSSTTATTTGSASAVATPNGQYTCVQGSIVANGSTALQPLATKVAQLYQSKCSGAQINVGPGGSKVGLSNAASGSAQIGDSDVFASSAQSSLVDHQVAVVIFVLAINPDVKGVTSLTTQQILDIYTGKDTNWNQVGGPNLPIVAVERPASSGTRATFKNYILNGQAEKPASGKALTVDSTGTVVQTIEQTSGSIGYITLGAADSEGSKLTVLSIDSVAPSSSSVSDNSYKFWNIEHMYTNGPASGLAAAFINYMGSSDAKTAADQLKFLQISAVSATALATHQVH